MINYTERITLLIDDLVKRVPALRYIDPTQPAGVRAGSAARTRTAPTRPAIA